MSKCGIFICGKLRLNSNIGCFEIFTAVGAVLFCTSLNSNIGCFEMNRRDSEYMEQKVKQ